MHIHGICRRENRCGSFGITLCGVETMITAKPKIIRIGSHLSEVARSLGTRLHMPTLAIYTNVHKSYVPDDFLIEASKVFQAAIGKPIEVRNCASIIF